MFLDIVGVPGESDRVGFRDSIEMEGFSWGSSDDSGGAAGCGTGADGSFYFDLTVSKQFDKASQRLMLANLNGSDLGTIKLRALKSTGAEAPEVYLTIELAHAKVSSDQLSALDGSVAEKVTFASQKATVTYRSQANDGRLSPPVVICYDAATQVDCTTP